MANGTLTILGCDGSFAGPGGAGSGYLVRTAAATIWLDAGPGTFGRLQEVCYPGTLDAIVLSHEHPDHWTDLESFAVWARHQNAGEPVLVLAPPGSASAPTSPTTMRSSGGWSNRRPASTSATRS